MMHVGQYTLHDDIKSTDPPLLHHNTLPFMGKYEVIFVAMTVRVVEDTRW